MTGIRLDGVEFRPTFAGPAIHEEKFVNASEFRALMVSHRRMVREDSADTLVRGLRDLDTGELFLINERRLFETRR